MDKRVETSEEIAGLVQTELETFTNEILRAKVAKFLITPLLQIREWDKPPYPEVPCWIVADFQHERGVGAACYQFGYGANGHFWNLVFVHNQQYLDSGNNSC